MRLDGQPFRIVGVSVPKGEQMNNMGPRDDEQVLLPITTAQTLFTGTDHIDYIIYEPRTREEGAQSIERVRAILGRASLLLASPTRRRCRSSTSPTPSS